MLNQTFDDVHPKTVAPDLESLRSLNELAEASVA